MWVWFVWSADGGIQTVCSNTFIVCDGSPRAQFSFRNDRHKQATKTTAYIVVPLSYILYYVQYVYDVKCSL